MVGLDVEDLVPLGGAAAPAVGPPEVGVVVGKRWDGGQEEEHGWEEFDDHSASIVHGGGRRERDLKDIKEEWWEQGAVEEERSTGAHGRDARATLIKQAGEVFVLDGFEGFGIEAGFFEGENSGSG